MIQDKDYIMRMVHEAVRMLIRLIFGRDMDHEEKDLVSLEKLELFKKLTAMIDDGEINEAENLLLDGLDPNDRDYFEMALLFYEKLGAKTEEFLLEHDYTQDEVVDGLKYIVDYYGHGELWDVISK